MKLLCIITFLVLSDIARAGNIDDCVQCIKSKKIYVRNLFSYSRREFACINTTEILEREAYLPLFRACMISQCLCLDSVIKNLSTQNFCREKTRYKCDCDETCSLQEQLFGESSSSSVHYYEVTWIARLYLILVFAVVVESTIF